MLKREYEDEGLSVLTDNQFAALIWRAGPTEARVASVERVLEGVSRRHPKGYGVVVVIGDSTPLPSMALRERIVGVLRKVTQHVRVVAWVVPSEGFHGSMVRSLFTALFLMLRPTFKPRAFQSLQEGLEYVLGGVGIVDASYLASVGLEIEARRRTQTVDQAK